MWLSVSQITVVCKIFVLHGVKVLDGFGTCHITVMVIFCVVYLEIYLSSVKFVGDLCGS